MSVNRLFLRTAAVAALLPEEGEAVDPTMAGKYVYDSRLTAISHTLPDGHHLPIIAVYTDDDEAVSLTDDVSGPRDREVILRIEFAIATFDTIKEDKTSYRVLAYPTLDAELEAKLDLFETQIKWALLYTGWRPGTISFLKMVKRVGTIKSVPMRDEEGASKISSRMLTMSCRIPDDCPPTFGIQGEEGANGKPKFDAFPGAPWLAPMLDAMAAQSPRHPVIDILGNVRTAAVYLPLLKRVGYAVDAVEPQADPDLLAQAGKTSGPDGKLEVEGMVEINE